MQSNKERNLEPGCRVNLMEIVMRECISFRPLRVSLAVSIGLLGLWSGTAAAAAGNAEAGAKKALYCAMCHGTDGNTTITGTPRLAGQSVEHFTAKMAAYRSGSFCHPMMGILNSGLNDQDIADMGAFYASQKPQDALKPYTSPMLK
jgi:cytochrome c553